MTPLDPIREMKAEITALRNENARLRELVAAYRKEREVGDGRTTIVCVCPDCLRKRK